MAESTPELNGLGATMNSLPKQKPAADVPEGVRVGLGGPELGSSGSANNVPAKVDLGQTVVLTDSVDVAGAVMFVIEYLDPGGQGNGGSVGGWLVGLFRDEESWPTIIGRESKFITMGTTWKLSWQGAMEVYDKEAKCGVPVFVPSLELGMVDVGLVQVSKSKRKRATSDMLEGCSKLDRVGVEFLDPFMG